MKDIRQTINYLNYLKSIGWITKRIKGTNFFIKKIPILGSVLKVQRPNQINFKTIKQLEEKYRVFQTIIEPDLTFTDSAIFHDLLSSNGYKLSRNPYLPSKTIHIDLTQSKKDIFDKFDKKCRYAIRKGEGLKIKEYSTEEEIKIWHKGFKKSVNITRFVPKLDDLLKFKKSFPQSHSIFLASHNIFGNIIGGALFTQSLHDFGYYWYGYTNNEGRTSLSQYSLLYHGILWAKRMGCKKFDLEGIYDSRFPDKSWLGFTHFKRSFGGKVVLYPGAYVKISLPSIFKNFTNN